MSPLLSPFYTPRTLQHQFYPSRNGEESSTCRPWMSKMEFLMFDGSGAQKSLDGSEAYFTLYDTSGVPVRCHGFNIYKYIVSHILHI
jgi:hypothetical protein